MDFKEQTTVFIGTTGEKFSKLVENVLLNESIVPLQGFMAMGHDLERMNALRAARADAIALAALTYAESCQPGHRGKLLRDAVLSLRASLTKALPLSRSDSTEVPKTIIKEYEEFLKDNLPKQKSR